MCVNDEDASFVEKYEGERKIFYVPEEENQSLLLTLLFDTDSYTMPIAAEYRRGNVENDMGCVRLNLLGNATAPPAVHTVLKKEITKEEFLALRDFLEEDFTIEF